MRTVSAGVRCCTRPWTPRAPARENGSVIDADGIALAALAEAACRHAAAAIAPSLRASAGPVDRAEYEDKLALADRAWRGRAGGREFWWVIEETSQRWLLAIVLGGSPAQSTTAMERTIVEETVARLASCGNPAEGRFDEELRARPRGSVWHCQIALTEPATGTAVLSIFTTRTAPARTRHPIDIGAVPLSCTAVLPPLRVRVGDVLRWRPGTVLGLQRFGEDVIAEIRLSPATTASGSLGVGSGKRLIRLDRFHKRGQP